MEIETWVEEQPISHSGCTYLFFVVESESFELDSTAHTRQTMLLHRCPFNNTSSYKLKPSILCCSYIFHSTCSKDYYKILGLSETATAKDIKRAYFEAAKLHHPDSVSSMQRKSRFYDISEAYEVLGNVNKRVQYDIAQRGVTRNHFHQRFNSDIRGWDQPSGFTHQFYDRESEVDETPISRQEYMTFFYCAFVSLFGIYVMIGILKSHTDNGGS